MRVRSTAPAASPLWMVLFSSIPSVRGTRMETAAIML